MSISSTTIFRFFLRNAFETYQVYYSLTFLSLLNSILLLSTFSVFLKSLSNYFFRWLTYKSLLSRFSVLISHTMWPSNLFSVSSCFQRFSWSRFFRVQVFQGLGFSGSRSRVQVQVLEVACFIYIALTKHCRVIKLGEFNSDKIYFAWWITKSWKPKK